MKLKPLVLSWAVISCLSAGVAFATEPSKSQVDQDTNAAEHAKADNTKKNVRDRNDNTLTPIDQPNNERDVELAGAVRSAIGGFGGSLATMMPEDLGALVAREAFVRAGVDPKQSSYAVVGNVIPCSVAFPYVCRLATVRAGMPMESVVMSCNRLCGSAMQAIINVAQNIQHRSAELPHGVRVAGQHPAA